MSCGKKQQTLKMSSAHHEVTSIQQISAGISGSLETTLLAPCPAYGLVSGAAVGHGSEPDCSLQSVVIGQ